MDQLAAFVVSWIGVYFIETIVLGSYGWPGFFVKAIPASLIGMAVARQNWPLWTSLREGILESRGPQALASVKPTIVVFGQEIDRPAFFIDIYKRRGGQAFDAAVYWENVEERITTGKILISGVAELTQRRMLEAMIESARLLRHKRGYDITDRLNNTIWPDVYPEGILVETVENDDGSTSAILAVGIQHSLSRQEWAEAAGKGFGSFRSAWNDHPQMRAKVRLSSGVQRMLKSKAIPLFHLSLREIVLPSEQPDDALGGPAVAIDAPADLPRG